MQVVQQFCEVIREGFINGGYAREWKRPLRWCRFAGFGDDDRDYNLVAASGMKIPQIKRIILRLDAGGRIEFSIKEPLRNLTESAPF